MPTLITNKRTSHTTIPTGRGIALLPGVNEVDSDAWTDAMKIPIVAKMVEDGHLVVTTADSVASMRPAEAVKLVGETYNLGLLRKWRDDDNRKAVTVAIDAQIRAIEDAMAKRASKADK